MPVIQDGDADEIEAFTRELLALSHRFSQLPPVLILEASGGFEANIAPALAAIGPPLCIVNPRQNRDFARALGRPAKTNALGNEVIAVFPERIRPPARSLAELERNYFAELMSQEGEIRWMINIETNRRDQTVDKQLIRRLNRHITFIERAPGTRLRHRLRARPIRVLGGVEWPGWR